MSTPRPPANAPGDRPHPRFLWKSRPVFLSSTFRDLHAERDYLRGHAFPELEEKLRSRAHHLETIDLRQGVETGGSTDEEARELKVLKVCLDEIRRSRPFFVGLLGDRYGWVPNPARMNAAARAAGFARDVAGHSVTELEILYGVLESADQRRRSWFYFRETDYRGMPEERRRGFDDGFLAGDPQATEAERAAAADRVHRLTTLKERIRTELPDRWRTYRVRWDAPDAGLKELSAMVVADLWSDLDTETRDALRTAPRTWQEADRQVLLDFVADRLRGLVERPVIEGRLLDHALGPAADGTPWGLVVTGEAGAGKSSLFARVYQELAGRDDVLLLGNAAGISVGAGQADRMLRRWIGELASFLKVPNPVPDETTGDQSGAQRAEPRGGTEGKPLSERLDQAFAALLFRAAQQVRVVVMLDALNQFENTVRAQHLTWLPPMWPENARLVATAIAGTGSAALLKRPGTVGSPLPPADRTEAEEIARTFFRERHHREVNERVLGALLDRKSPDGRPAHGNPLWLALALQEMNLLEADDYERAEREYPQLRPGERIEALQVAEAQEVPPEVPGVYGHLLSRAERLHGRKWTRALVDLIALGRGGWRESDLRALVPVVSGLAWEDLAFAEVRRALGPHLVQRGAEAQWDFFHSQLREAVVARNLTDPGERRGLHGQLAAHLQRLPTDDLLRQSETMFHLVGQGDGASAARYVAGLALGSGERAGAAATLAGLIETHERARDGTAVEAWTGGLLTAAETTAAEHGSMANFLIFDLNDRLEVARAAEPARAALLEAARAELERLAAADPTNAGWQGALSVSHDRVGDVLRAQGNLGEALGAYRASLGIRERLAAADPTNAGWQRDLSVSHDGVGDVLLAQGNLGEALGAYQATHAILKRLAAADPTNAGWQRDLSASHDQVGNVLIAQGNLGEALGAYRASLGVRERLAAADPTNAGWQRDLSDSQINVGDVLIAQGNLGEALEAYRASLGIGERLAAADPTNAGWQRNLSVSHERVGDALLAQGNLGEALGAYRRSLGIGERLAAADPTNAGWQRDLLVSHGKVGNVLLAQENLSEALGAYRTSLGIGERLAAADPTNAVWQRDLWVSYWKIANLADRQGNPGAHLWWRKAHDTLADIKHRGLFLSAQDEKFLEQLRLVLRDLPAAGMPGDPERTNAVEPLGATSGGEEGTTSVSLPGPAVPAHSAVPAEQRWRGILASARAALARGQSEEAIVPLRRLIFPQDGLRLDPNSPIEARVLFVEALMQAQNVEGVETYLGQLEDAEHPRIPVLRDAMQRWRASLGWMEKLGLKKKPPIPVPPQDESGLAGDPTSAEGTP